MYPSPANVHHIVHTPASSEIVTEDETSYNPRCSKLKCYKLIGKYPLTRFTISPANPYQPKLLKMKQHISLICLAAAAISSAQTFNIVAHQDDDLLFMNPNIQQDIQSGRSVRTVFITAGDAGNDESYWLSREAGSKAAYAQMSGGDNVWTSLDLEIPGFNIASFSLDSDPNISLVYLRLPDGNNGGEGFGNGSLQQLWEGSIPSLTSYTGSSYSREDLVNVLRQLGQNFDFDHVNTQDFVHDYGDGDHSDHHSVGFFVKEALDCGEGVLLTSYMGYPATGLSSNVNDGDLDEKRAVFYTYAGYDRNTCDSPEACSGRDEEQWVQRQYVVDSLWLPACDGESEHSSLEATVYRHVTVSGACPAPSSSVEHGPITPASMSVQAPTSTQETKYLPSQTPSDMGVFPTQQLFQGGSIKSIRHSSLFCIFAALASTVFIF